MSRVPLTLAISDYDHVRDLVTGRVPVEGVELTCLQLDVEEIFYRFTSFREWHVSELSLTKYVALARDGTLAAIPVFPSRVFRHSAIYVARGSAVADLAGARVGVPEWFQTAGVWVRGILADEYGLSLDAVRWFQAGVRETGRRELFTPPVPIEIVADRTLTDMLVAGDLDAVITARPPAHPGVVPWWPDAVERERDWHRRTGIFPIMHVVVIRRDVLDAHPWLAANLLTAFTEARDRSLDRLRDLNASRFPVPWLPSLAAGATFPYGVEPNRRTLETFLRYAHQQGITPEPLTVDELFPASVRSTYRI
ncbi:type 2 periplasmic-binding domain-containing protein [Actinoplanes sp. RD1]|uniref:ABC transporter substrate-binding protein n=1 Tax=Actinoplanes sp. RD1 TaxID=3064538 RepID=UPI002741E548|nr:ABC transporter substrate-binding protein [Actinoplanes sp. RD1]